MAKKTRLAREPSDQGADEECLNQAAMYYLMRRLADGAPFAVAQRETMRLVIHHPKTLQIAWVIMDAAQAIFPTPNP